MLDSGDYSTTRERDFHPLSLSITAFLLYGQGRFSMEFYQLVFKEALNDFVIAQAFRVAHI